MTVLFAKAAQVLRSQARIMHFNVLARTRTGITIGGSARGHCAQGAPFTCGVHRGQARSTLHVEHLSGMGRTHIDSHSAKNGAENVDDSAIAALQIECSAACLVFTFHSPPAL